MSYKFSAYLQYICKNTKGFPCGSEGCRSGLLARVFGVLSPLLCGVSIINSHIHSHEYELCIYTATHDIISNTKSCNNKR